MKKRFNVTRSIEFDAGHRIPYHTSKCRNVHGHRYKLEVTLSGPLVIEGAKRADEGMVLDFTELKNMLMLIHGIFDHKFIVCMTDPLARDLQTLHRITTIPASILGLRYEVENFGWVQEVPGVPTAENLAFYCWTVLDTVLLNKTKSSEVLVESVRLWETPNCMVEYIPCAKN